MNRHGTPQCKFYPVIMAEMALNLGKLNLLTLIGEFHDPLYRIKWDHSFKDPQLLSSTDPHVIVYQYKLHAPFLATDMQIVQKSTIYQEQGRITVYSSSIPNDEAQAYKAFEYVIYEQVNGQAKITWYQ